MIENDKKMGNYREGFSYARETRYMMTVYDVNRDLRLSRL
jgi:hypothetical protein